MHIHKSIIPSYNLEFTTEIILRINLRASIFHAPRPPNVCSYFVQLQVPCHSQRASAVPHNSVIYMLVSNYNFKHTIGSSVKHQK